jgi:nitrogen regulatory protein PII
MKLIVAIIRPETLDAITTALDEPGLCLTSVSRVVDGQAPALTERFRGGKSVWPGPDSGWKLWR